MYILSEIFHMYSDLLLRAYSHILSGILSYLSCVLWSCTFKVLIAKDHFITIGSGWCYIWCAMDPNMDPINIQYAIYVSTFLPAPWIRHGIGLLIDHEMTSASCVFHCSLDSPGFTKKISSHILGRKHLGSFGPWLCGQASNNISK